MDISVQVVTAQTNLIKPGRTPGWLTSAIKEYYTTRVEDMQINYGIDEDHGT
jgi:hypothetical protein